MSDLIRRPEDLPAPLAISKTEFEPVKATDDPKIYRGFVNAIRRIVGLKPLELSVRYATAEVQKREAEVASVEIDNQVKLLKAKQEFERVQAEIRRQDLVAQGQLEKANAEADEIRANTRSKKALARVQEAAARAIERRGQSREAALERFLQLLEKIRALGGDVEIEPLDGEFGEDETEELNPND